MSSTNVSSLNRSVQTTQEWLKDLAEQGHLEDESQAYSVLRAVLHTLRDRLTVDETADAASQMPTLVRGIFYENWKPSQCPKKYSEPEKFYEQVRHELRQGTKVDAHHATEAALSLLDRHLSQGQVRQIRNMLPEELRTVWPEAA